jgi:hypothetical protein
MPYANKQHLANDLQALKIDKWDWRGDSNATIDLKTGKKPALPAGTAEDVADYCWCAYDKARKAGGDQVIGRVTHLKGAGLYKQVADLAGKQDTLFTKGAQGNLLQMDKWARVINDSWILGGVHRGAKFRLTSPRSLENLWNFAAGYASVTAREILGLLHFGYRFQQVGPWQLLVSANPGGAMTASLMDYDRLMSSQTSITQMLKLVDTSTLKPR